MFVVNNKDIANEVLSNPYILSKLNIMDKIIYEEFFKNSYKDKKKLKRINHMKLVTLISLKILNSSEKIKKELDYEKIEDMIFGAMLHDIKKFDSDYEYDNHAKLGALFVLGNKDLWELLLMDEKRIQNIASIIRNHKKGYNTKLYVKDKEIYVKDKENSKRNIQVKLVQDSDKISEIFKENNYNNEEKVKKIREKILSKKGLNFNASLEYLNNEIKKIFSSSY